jgi:hypothetical protein
VRHNKINSKNKTRTETQIKFYKVMAVSDGRYDSENWVLTEKDKNRIQAAEMRFLRPTMGVTRQNRLTNEAIRKTLNTNNLNDTIGKYTDNLVFRAVFWVVLPCKMIVDRRFRGAYCLHHQGK